MASSHNSSHSNGDDHCSSGHTRDETDRERSDQMGVREDEDETQEAQSYEREDDVAHNTPLPQQLPTRHPLNASEALPEFVRSDRHTRLPHNHPIPNQPRTIGSGADAGSNLMALFGDENTPRTRYNLRVEEGRMGNDAWRRYPPATRVIPGRLTLEEICRWYPNHVWGTGLRLFESEGWKAKQIFENLPTNARNHGAGSRPWNYLQARVLREKKVLYEEQTRRKWNPVPKRLGRIPSPSRNPPVVAPGRAVQPPPILQSQPQPQPQPQQHRRRPPPLSLALPLPPPQFPFQQQPPRAPAPPLETELQRLARLTVSERTRVLNILIRLNQVQDVMFPRTTAEQQLDEHERTFVQRLNAELARRVPGARYWQDPVDIVRVLWQQDHFRDITHNENMPDYMDRSNRAARRVYMANLQHWGERWEQLIRQLTGQ